MLATSAHNKVMVTSWESIKTARIADEQYSALLHHVQSDENQWPNLIGEYKKFQDHLSTDDGVVLYRGRVVVPKVLQHQVLRSLHQAHQGASTMVLRTHESVWWPSITKDLADIRASCLTCTRNAPSQLPMPPVDLPQPEYPFQLVSCDYFHLQGHQYLVLVDRYSNWPVVRKCRNESAQELH